MYCLKCGNETENDQVFCNHCTEIMEQYPVKPGTIVRIPRRAANPALKKQSRRKTLGLDEQVVHLKIAVRTLTAILGAALILLGIFAWLYFDAIGRIPNSPEPSKGTNYQVVDNAD